MVNYSLIISFIIQVFSSVEHLRRTNMSIGFDVRQNCQRNGNIQSFHLFDFKLYLLSSLYAGAVSCGSGFHLKSLHVDENLKCSGYIIHYFLLEQNPCVLDLK
jgi:hypothetical protein